jgi:DNA repair exonuclease SbcCD ATPase subunit
VIPLRIMLKGFLCYRDEQEVLLDGSSLWMMAGLNGSGKSAVFDAMTFALFGTHRGGSQQLAELINHDSDRLVVEFDFALDGQTYQIKRTVARKAQGGANVTQQIYQLKPADVPGGAGTKEALPDTSRKTEFNAWVREHIGLTYETFTSSVLLLQGRAEKLLDSTASGRFEVLAGIVDLDRYRRLHDRADTRRKELKARVEALQHQLEGLPTITDMELAEVDGRIATAEEERRQAQAEVERLQDRERQARQWADLQGRYAGLEQKWQQAQGVLAEAEAIQKNLKRLQELKEVLPHLLTAADRRSKVRDSLKKAEQLAVQEQALAEKLAECDHAIDQTRKKQDALRKNLAGDELKHREVNRQLRDLSSVLSQVKLCEQQRETMARQEKELAAFPPDLVGRLARLRQDADRLTELDRAFPLLARLHGQRSELRQAREQEQSAVRHEKQVRERGDLLKKKQAALAQALATAERERQQTDEKATEARTLFNQAQAQVKEFLHLEGAKVCRACGQPLTRSHFDEEKKKREGVLAEARTTSQQTERTQKAKQQEEARRREEMAACERELTEARDEFRDSRRQMEQARRDVERLGSECGRAFDDLPPLYRERVGVKGDIPDWTATAFPTDADLAGLREQVRQVEGVRRQLQEAQALHGRWQALTAQGETTRQTLNALEAELPHDVGAVRRKHLNLESNERTLDSSIKAAREEDRAAQLELDRLVRERGNLQQRRTEAAGKLSTEEAGRKMYQEEVERLRKKLPPEWQREVDSADLSSMYQWEGEKKKLEDDRTEDRAQRLQQTMIELESLRQRRQEVLAECEGFSVEARLPAAEIHAAWESARRAQEAAETALRKAQHDRAILDSQRQQRDHVEKQLLEQQAEHNRYHLLAQLLGRDRLQRHLVRQAERQVVDHANAVLDRLSGGQLYLRLRGSDDGDSAEKALELESYNRTTAQAPINVAFLSGSQRFRVAVALALGLGQYASRQHRPIESVIIDEGFGCLDRQGRQVMIQELQNLRGQLRCILLVSHQEEFADAFSDGYLFELAGGSTRIKRFQR